MFKSDCGIDSLQYAGADDDSSSSAFQRSSHFHWRWRDCFDSNALDYPKPLLQKLPQGILKGQRKHHKGRISLSIF